MLIEGGGDLNRGGDVNSVGSADACKRGVGVISIGGGDVNRGWWGY